MCGSPRAHAVRYIGGAPVRCVSPLRRCSCRELAGEAGVLDQPPPSLTAPELPRHLSPTRQRAVRPAVGQRPLPGPSLKRPAAIWHCPARWKTIDGPGYDRYMRQQRWGAFKQRFLDVAFACLHWMQWRSAAGAGCGGLPDLPHQQLIAAGQGKTGPGSGNPADQGWLGHRDIGGQARQGADDQECPGQDAATAAKPRIRQQRLDEATIIPSHDNGISADAHAPSPCCSARICMWVYDTTAAIPANSSTVAIVVQRIHRSAV